MKLSINKNIINKNETKAHQSKDFEALDLNVDEFVAYINAGYAFSYQFENNHRKAENFICSDIIAADFDDGMTLEEALNNQFFINHASFLYTTTSHTADNNRFRVVFQLPNTITDKDLIRSAQTGLARKFPADIRSVDAARQFYGSKNCTSHIFDKLLSEENLNELIKLGKEKLKLSDSSVDNSNVAGSRSDLVLADDISVKSANGDYYNLSDLEPSKPVYCPYHHDNKPSAFTTLSKQGVIGIHCASCEQTFWPKDKEPPKYNFFEFDELVKSKNINFSPTMIEDEFGHIKFDDINPCLMFNEQYLNDLNFNAGTTLIKSPKGTGKTHYLKKLVGELKDKKLKILLVGHRRSLINDLSNKLGLVSYIDNNQQLKKGLGTSDKQYFAVSVDSISTCLNPAQDKFNVIIIDESEQVFSHLISDLIPFQKRNSSYAILKHYIHMAQHCIALDADLNNVTLSAIKGFGNKNPFMDSTFILNEYKADASSIEIFSTENHLTGQIFADIEDGKRLYICSNSKIKIDHLVSSIQHQFGKDYPLFWITSKNSSESTVAHFIENIKNECLKYQVILTSPVLGTGIDITFPDNEQLVDGVYGLFEAKINTHHDIDQQISRVRHPGFVRVWISPEKFNFETESEPIKQELAENGLVPHVLKTYSWTGVPEYNFDDPYLNLYATILCAQRASKNNLKENFIHLRQYNGWKIIEVSADESLTSEGAFHTKVGRELSEKQRVEGILNAKPITPNEANILMKKSELSQVEKYTLDRYLVHRFYKMPVTENLLIRDKDGKYRIQIKMLEDIISASDPQLRKIASKKTLLLKSIFAQANILNEHGIPDPNLKVTAKSLNDFSNFCIKNKSRINRELKIDVRADISHTPVNQLNGFLKLCGLSTTKVNQFEKDQKRIYQYAVNPNKLEEALVTIKIRKSN
jgi:hypothetical protein